MEAETTTTPSPCVERPCSRPPDTAELADDPTLEFDCEDLAGRDDDELVALSPSPLERTSPFRDRRIQKDLRTSARSWKLVQEAADALALVAGIALAQTDTAATGSVRVHSEPAGAEVRIGGALHGLTPLSMALPTGSHQMSIRLGALEKQLPIDIAGEVAATYHVIWPAEAAKSAPISPDNLPYSPDLPYLP